VLIALCFSCGLGIPFGILIGWYKVFESTVGTLFELIRPIPPIAWLPLVIMLMGIGEIPKIVIVFIGTFTPIVLNTATSIRLVDPLYLNVGRMFNANERQLLFSIALPASLPAIFAGFRTATSGGLMVVMAAEMIGAQAGLGFLIQRGMDAFDVPLIMVGMIVIGAVGALLAVLTNYLERLICHEI
jgi:NitT/TauT family transport system permease protein/sulfonate transport system permease protein